MKRKIHTLADLRRIADSIPPTSPPAAPANADLRQVADSIPPTIPQAAPANADSSHVCEERFNDFEENEMDASFASDRADAETESLGGRTGDSGDSSDPDSSGDDTESSDSSQSDSEEDEDADRRHRPDDQPLQPMTKSQNLTCAVAYLAFKGHTSADIDAHFGAGRYLFEGPKLCSSRELRAEIDRVLQPVQQRVIFFCQSCHSELRNSLEPCSTVNCPLRGFTHSCPQTANYSIAICSIIPQLESLVQWNWEKILATRPLIRHAKENFPHQCDLSQRFVYPAFCDFVETPEMLNDRKLNLTLSINFDGVHTDNVTKNVWPVYLGLNDVPTASSDTLDCMMAAAVLYVNSGLPSLRQSNRLLSLIETELDLLQTEGMYVSIEGEQWHLTFKLVNFSVDLQAEVLFFGKHGWLNANGCPDCEDGSRRENHTTKWFVTLPPGTQLTPRNPMTRNDAELGQNGFKALPPNTEPSLLLNHVLPQEVNADALHLVYHGFMKDMLLDAYSNGGRRAFFVLNDDKKKELTNMEMKMKFPQSERHPGSHSYVGKMTSSQTETFLFSTHLVSCATVSCTQQGAGFMLLLTILLLMYLDAHPTPAFFIEIEDMSKEISSLWLSVCGDRRDSFKIHRFIHHVPAKLFHYGSVFLNTTTRWEKCNRWLAANFSATDTRGPFRLFLERFVLKMLMRPILLKLDHRQPKVRTLFKDLGLGKTSRMYKSKVLHNKINRLTHALIETQVTGEYELFAKLKRGYYTYSSEEHYCGEIVGNSSFALICENKVYTYVKIVLFVKPHCGHSLIIVKRLRPIDTLTALLGKLD